MNIIRQAISTTSNIVLEIYDKTNKNTEYNYLVEISLNGRTTGASQFFTELEDAHAYYEGILQQGNHIETISK